MPIHKETRKALQIGIRALVLQEVRLLWMKQVSAPEIMKDEIYHSLTETKREIIRLTRSLDDKKRSSLLKKMIQQAVDEEIDRAIALRKNRCLRCIHGRFYDHSETPHLNLPLDEHLAQAYGCDQFQPALRKSCQRFKEIATAHPFEEYLDGIALLYELREGMDQVEELWREYFTK